MKPIESNDRAERLLLATLALEAALAEGDHAEIGALFAEREVQIGALKGVEGTESLKAKLRKVRVVEGRIMGNLVEWKSSALRALEGAGNGRRAAAAYRTSKQTSGTIVNGRR